jgi:hypothetical protein
MIDVPVMLMQYITVNQSAHTQNALLQQKILKTFKVFAVECTATAL